MRGRIFQENGFTVYEGLRLASDEHAELFSKSIVKAIFQNCFWPVFTVPTPLFKAGSSEIKIFGPPTPRNIIFPKDTEFLVSGKEVYTEHRQELQLVARDVYVETLLDVGDGKGVRTVTYKDTVAAPEEVTVKRPLTQEEKDALSEFTVLAEEIEK